MEKIFDAANRRIEDMQPKYQRWVLGRVPPVSFYVTDLGRAFVVDLRAGYEGRGAARGEMYREPRVAGGLVHIPYAVRSADSGSVRPIQDQPLGARFCRAEETRFGIFVRRPHQEGAPVWTGLAIVGVLVEAPPGCGVPNFLGVSMPVSPSTPGAIPHAMHVFPGKYRIARRFLNC